MVVVSNLLAQRPQPPPPPPPQHPGEGTIVVVQLVQLVVVAEVTLQVTEVTPTGISITLPNEEANLDDVSFPPGTPVSLPPLTREVIGLLTGSIAMFGAAVYLIKGYVELMPSLGASEIKPEEGSGNTDKLFADLDSIAKAKDLDKLDEAQKDLSKLNEGKAKLNQDKSRLTVEGTAGVALLEDAKDAITTFVSNVTSIIDKTKDAAKKIARDMA